MQYLLGLRGLLQKNAQSTHVKIYLSPSCQLDVDSKRRRVNAKGLGG